MSCRGTPCSLQLYQRLIALWALLQSQLRPGRFLRPLAAQLITAPKILQRNVSDPVVLTSFALTTQLAQSLVASTRNMNILTDLESKKQAILQAPMVASQWTALNIQALLAKS